jgi:hypothetical protein
MHNIINAINWEHVMLVLVSILGAFGASRAWLKKLCAKLDDSKSEVDILRQEIKDLRSLFDAKEDKK